MTWAYTTWTGLFQSSTTILCHLKNHTLHTCIPSWRNLKGWPRVGSRHTAVCITAQTPWRQWNKRRFYSNKIDRSPGSFSGQIYSLSCTELQRSPQMKHNQWQKFCLPAFQLILPTNNMSLAWWVPMVFPWFPFHHYLTCQSRKICLKLTYSSASFGLHNGLLLGYLLC